MKIEEETEDEQRKRSQDYKNMVKRDKKRKFI